jgi:hypothetical protein
MGSIRPVEQCWGDMFAARSDFLIFFVTLLLSAGERLYGQRTDAERRAANTLFRSRRTVE